MHALEFSTKEKMPYFYFFTTINLKVHDKHSYLALHGLIVLLCPESLADHV